MNKKDKLSWENGLKIDSTLDENLKGGIQRVRNKKATLFVVDGGVGEGKTTLGTICGKRIAEHMNQPFDIHEQVRQGGRSFLQGMDWAVNNKRNVVVYDEAGDFNTRASLTYFNQTMNRVFETYRALGIIVILCLPSFSDVDTSLMKKKIARFLVHCYNRNNDYGCYKVYSLWRMWYLKKKFSKVTVPDDAYRMVAPNFFGRFRDLDPADSKKLENISIRGKKNIIRKGMLQERGLVTIKNIADRAGYSVETVRRFLKRKKYKGEKYGSTLYYNKDVVEALVAEKERKGRVS